MGVGSGVGVGVAVGCAVGVESGFAVGLTVGRGVSGISQRRFRGMIRFLQSYARGEETDLPQRPPKISLPQYVRYCVDDLKAFYYEARLAQRPESSEPEIQTWFWSDTADT